MPLPVLLSINVMSGTISTVASFKRYCPRTCDGMVVKKCHVVRVERNRLRKLATINDRDRLVGGRETKDDRPIHHFSLFKPPPRCMAACSRSLF